jgi:Rieske Fe-S protein
MCLAFAGSTLLLSLLESCATMPVYKAPASLKKVSVPIEKFLTAESIIVRPEGYTYDVALIKTADTFSAFIMKCTHADNPVRFDGQSFSCNLHGSKFDRAGKVAKGPAEKPLFMLTTEKLNDQIIISLI